MLPHAYELPVAVLMLLAGALSCFAGYRLFRIVLGIYGFILGAMLASSIVGVTNTAGQIGAAVLGGLAGALILVFAYFVGIAIVGAGLGAFVAHLIWRQIDTSDPPAAAIIVSAMAGGIGAMLLQRYVIVVATAFSGAWTMIVGGLSIASELARRNAVKPLPTGDVWILYPFTAASENRWVIVAWVVLSIAGITVQLAFSSKKRK